METKAHNVMVGGFILAGIAALLITIMWIAGGQLTPYAQYQTVFTGSVTGLGKGTLVRYNGIDVGRVTKLAFDRDDPKRVVTDLEVQPDIAIHQDSTATVESEGLTGAVYVEIEGGTPTAPVLMPNGRRPAVIVSKPSPFQQVKEAAPKLINDLNTVADRGADLLNDENRKAFAETLANLTVASNHLTQALNTTNEAAKRVGQLSADADEVVTASKHQIAESTAQLNQLLAQSRALVESLTRLSNDIERQPTELLYGDRRQGYKPK